VRYYACEALFNIAKVGRARVAQPPLFNEIFDGLCKLAADPDLNVKNGAQLLDRLLKDIVTESASFQLDRFVPLLQERVHVINPFVRSFLLGWITLLDSVPGLQLVHHLPAFLEGIFNMLSDPKKEIRREAEHVLAEFRPQLSACAPASVAGTVLSYPVKLLRSVTDSSLSCSHSQDPDSQLQQHGRGDSPNRPELGQRVPGLQPSGARRSNNRASCLCFRFSSCCGWPPSTFPGNLLDESLH
jgi:hypothetical protein